MEIANNAEAFCNRSEMHGATMWNSSEDWALKKAITAKSLRSEFKQMSRNSIQLIILPGNSPRLGRRGCILNLCRTNLRKPESTKVCSCGKREQEEEEEEKRKKGERKMRGRRGWKQDSCKSAAQDRWRIDFCCMYVSAKPMQMDTHGTAQCSCASKAEATQTCCVASFQTAQPQYPVQHHLYALACAWNSCKPAIFKARGSPQQGCLQRPTSTASEYSKVMLLHFWLHNDNILCFMTSLLAYMMIWHSCIGLCQQYPNCRCDCSRNCGSYYQCCFVVFPLMQLFVQPWTLQKYCAWFDFTPLAHCNCLHKKAITPTSLPAGNLQKGNDPNCFACWHFWIEALPSCLLTFLQPWWRFWARFCSLDESVELDGRIACLAMSCGFCLNV